MFYKVPKALFTEEKYSPVSTDAKMLYGLLLDRMHLSAKNGWTDRRGRIYQFFTVKEAQEKLRFGHEKICRLFSELEQADLILRKRQGQGKPTKIYVKRFTTREVPPKKEEIPAPISEVEILDVQKSEIPTSRGRKPRLQEVGISDPSYLDNNYPEFIS